MKFINWERKGNFNYFIRLVVKFQILYKHLITCSGKHC